MQKLISQIPELAQYLAKIPKKQHHNALRQVVRAGLQSLHNHSCKENLPEAGNLGAEIDRIKENLMQLNQMVKHQCHHCCSCLHPNNQRKTTQPLRNGHHNYGSIHVEDNSPNNFSFKPNISQNQAFEPPVRETSANYINKTIEPHSVNPFSKTKVVVSRHHLDDTEARSALTFPPQILAEVHHPSKRRSQQYKKHIYQQEINKEEQVKLKQERQEHEQDHRATRSISDHRKATSKIKSLLDKDRIRFHQRQREQSFREGFNKYEYSNQDQMQESSISEQQPPRATQGERSNRASYQDNTYNQHYHSSFKASNPSGSSQKPSSKKDFERSKKEVSSKLQASQGENLRQQHSSQKHKEMRASSDKYNLQQEQQDDAVSNSSSFSQFSISGSQKRDVGKISRRSNNP